MGRCSLWLPTAGKDDPAAVLTPWGQAGLPPSGQMAERGGSEGRAPADCAEPAADRLVRPGPWAPHWGRLCAWTMWEQKPWV